VEKVELVRLVVMEGAEVVAGVGDGEGLASLDSGDGFLGSISLFTHDRIFSLSILLTQRVYVVHTFRWSGQCLSTYFITASSLLVLERGYKYERNHT